MTTEQKVWYDGKLIPWDNATIHVSAHALHYGSCVYEGIRAYATVNGPAVLGLAEHTRRLAQSAKIFKINLGYSEEAINEAILETLRVNELPSAYIRPLAIRGVGTLSVNGSSNPIHLIILTLNWGAYLGEEAIEQGVDVMVSSWRRMAPSTLPAMGKISGNYVNSQLIVMEAQERGFAEGIALDTNGLVSEGSGENIFLVLDRVVYTPPLSSSILSGITRRFVMTLIADQGYELREQTIPREMLYVADELFFTGTAAEITPIRSVDGYTIGRGGRGPITEALQQDFFAIVKGHAPDRHGWLTPVHRG